MSEFPQNFLASRSVSPARAAAVGNLISDLGAACAPRSLDRLDASELRAFLDARLAAGYHVNTAFEAFATYRDMAYQRSLAAVGWRLHKSRSLLSRWSAAHGWVKRVAAWDAYNRESRNELEQERRRTRQSSMGN